MNRTLEVVEQLEKIVGSDQAVPGYSILDGTVQSNSAFVIGRLKPFEARTTPCWTGHRYPPRKGISRQRLLDSGQ